MGLELRGFFFYFVSDFAVEEHEGREALFRHRLASRLASRQRVNSLARVGGDVSERRLSPAVRGAGVRRLFRFTARGSLAPGAAFAARSRYQRLTNDLMCQTTQRGGQRIGLRWSAGVEKLRANPPLSEMSKVWPSLAFT